MSELEILHMRLQEVLKKEAAATMAAYEQGIQNTQHNLEGCLDELHKAQAAAEQQHQVRVQQIQQEYQQDLEHLTQQYEEQVRRLEQATKERVTAAHTEAAEIMTQAAAQLLYTLQQQQQQQQAAADEAAAVSPWNGLLEPTLDDIHQLQQPSDVLQHPQTEQHADQLQLQQQPHIYSQQKQQQLHHEQEWVQQLQQHRQSWQQLEQEELLLHEPSSIRRPSTSREVYGPPALLATSTAGHSTINSGENQRQQHGLSPPQRAGSLGHAGISCISAPASLSVSRRSSRTRNSAPDADAQWQVNSQTQTVSKMLQPPPQLLRALSATELLRRASSCRQQLQQGLLEGLRRASEASSGASREEINSTIDRKAWAQLTKPDDSKELQASRTVWTGEQRVSTAEALPSGRSRRVVDEALVEKQQRLLRQSHCSEAQTPWRLRSVNGREPALIASQSPQRPMLMAHKATTALDLLDTDSD